MDRETLSDRIATLQNSLTGFLAQFALVTSEKEAVTARFQQAQANVVACQARIEEVSRFLPPVEVPPPEDEAEPTDAEA